MPITKCAPTARWQWSYEDGRYLGIEVEGTDTKGHARKGTLKAQDLATLRRRLTERGLSRADATRITIETR
jgi:hypothetical protein